MSVYLLKWASQNMAVIIFSKLNGFSLPSKNIMLGGI